MRRDRLREQAREQDSRRKQAEKIIAIQQLREVEADLDDLLIRQALRGAGKAVPHPTYTGKQSDERANSKSESSDSNASDDEYTDYVLDAPVAITGKPARSIKIKARRNVMELHQQIQDLNQVLIDDVKRNDWQAVLTPS